MRENESPQPSEGKPVCPRGKQSRALHWPAKAATRCRLPLQLWLSRQVAEALRKRAHRRAHALPSSLAPDQRQLSSVQQTTTI